MGYARSPLFIVRFYPEIARDHSMSRRNFFEFRKRGGVGGSVVMWARTTSARDQKENAWPLISLYNPRIEEKARFIISCLNSLEYRRKIFE